MNNKKNLTFQSHALQASLVVTELFFSFCLLLALGAKKKKKKEEEEEERKKKDTHNSPSIATDIYVCKCLI